MTEPSVIETTLSGYGIVFDHAYMGHGVPVPPVPLEAKQVIGTGSGSYGKWGYHPETSPPIIDVLMVFETGRGYDIYSERSWEAFFKAQASIDELRTAPGTTERFLANTALVHRYVRRMHLVGRELREFPSSNFHIVDILSRRLMTRDGDAVDVSNSCTLINRFTFSPKPHDWKPYHDQGGKLSTEAPIVPWKEPNVLSKPEYDGSSDNLIEPIPGRKCIKEPKK